MVSGTPAVSATVANGGNELIMVVSLLVSCPRSTMQTGAGLAAVRLDTAKRERGDEGNSIQMCYSGEPYGEVFKRSS